MSNRNLAVAMTKVARYYRTQNFAGTPDAGMLDLMDTAMLRAMVMDGSYRFQPLRPYFTEKKSGAVRMETISSPLDRVVIQALFNRIGYQIQGGLSLSATVRNELVAPAYRFNSPRSKYIFSFWPTDYRAHRNRMVRLARRHRRGVVLHADIQNFYPSVDRRLVRNLLAPWFTEEVWPLVDQYLDFSLTHQETTRPLYAGLPIEEPISRLLGNMVLESLDRFALQELEMPYGRYVDDLTFFLPNEHAARETRQRIEEFLLVELGLAINAEKVEIAPTAELADGAAAAFSRRLSILNANLALVPFQPGLKKGMVGALKGMLKQMPDDTGEEAANQLKVRGVKFAAWRLARLKATRQVDAIGSLLIDERFQRIAAIALAYLGTPKAIQHLRSWLAEYGSSLSRHDQITVAAALARNNHLRHFPMLETMAATCPELLAVIRLKHATPRQLREGIADADPLVRRACALHLIGISRKPEGLKTALKRALKQEVDRDTRIAFEAAIKLFSGNATTTRLLKKRNKKEATPCHP